MLLLHLYVWLVHSLLGRTLQATATSAQHDAAALRFMVGHPTQRCARCLRPATLLLDPIGAEPFGYADPHDGKFARVNGDNWYWQTGPGYDPASGLGTIDVANLAKLLGF